MTSHGDHPVTLPLAALHDPSTHYPHGKGELVSATDADRVPWTPKGRWGKDRPGQQQLEGGSLKGLQVQYFCLTYMAVGSIIHALDLRHYN